MTTTNRLAFAVMLIFSFTFQTQTCHALSKSLTVRVSCTIAPNLQFSAKDAMTPDIVVGGNMGKQFITQSDMLMTAGQNIRMLSITAL